MGGERELFDKLNNLRGTKTLIVGIGSTLRGDDGAGPIVCERLREAGVSAELVDAGTVPENYIQTIIKKAPRNIIIIDAIEFGGSPGAVGVFKDEQLDGTVLSTHALSPRLFVEVIKRSIEVDIYFVGIQPGQTKLGEPMSAQVRQALEDVTDTLIRIFPPPV